MPSRRKPSTPPSSSPGALSSAEASSARPEASSRPASIDELARRDAKVEDDPPGLARLEHVDVATGEALPGTEAGTLPTGRVVARIERELVEVDPEDIIDDDQQDPRRRVVRYDLEGPVDYEARALVQKEQREAQDRESHERQKVGRTGLRETFDSATDAARAFVDSNYQFFQHVADPYDGIRDWMDGLEVRQGKRFVKLTQHHAGERILEMGRSGRRGENPIAGAIAYIFGQAKGRRWDAVDWSQIDRLGESLEPYYEQPDDGSAGTPGIYSRPYTGELTADVLEEMPYEQREAVRLREAKREIADALGELWKAYDEAGDCLPEDLRDVVERRMREWARWTADPTRIPAYACAPDPRTQGYTCDFPVVVGELRELRKRCGTYDSNWAAANASTGSAGFPDLSDAPSAGLLSRRAADLEDVPPWEREGAADLEDVPPWERESAADLEDVPPWEREGAADLEDVPPWEREAELDEGPAEVPAAAAEDLPAAERRREAPTLLELLAENSSEPPPAAELVLLVRALADAGRAYGAPAQRVKERKAIGRVIYQSEYGRCNKKDDEGLPACWCADPPADRPPGHGPYWYAYYLRRGRRVSKYIGLDFRTIDPA